MSYHGRRKTTGLGSRAARGNQEKDAQGETIMCLTNKCFMRYGQRQGLRSKVTLEGVHGRTPAALLNHSSLRECVRDIISSDSDLSIAFSGRESHESQTSGRHAGRQSRGVLRQRRRTGSGRLFGRWPGRRAANQEACLRDAKNVRQGLFEGHAWPVTPRGDKGSLYGMCGLATAGGAGLHGPGLLAVSVSTIPIDIYATERAAA